MRREIGRTGTKVLPIGLGTLPLSCAGRPSEREAIAVIRAAIAAGVELIDTADVYCLDGRDLGYSEALIAKALRGIRGRQRIIVATKGGMTRLLNGDWRKNAKPAHLRMACERSLRNLGVDSIFLYQLHAPDPKVPLEDSLSELVRLKDEGKIRHIGLSNVSLQELKNALRLTRIESVQNLCNPECPDDYRDGLQRFCLDKKISYIPYCPVGGKGSHVRLSSHPFLKEIGRKHGVSPYRVMLSWHLGKGKNVLPIPGARRKQSILDSVEAVHLKLDSEDLRWIKGLTGPGPVHV